MNDKNSKRTRVEPIFTYLQQHGGRDWPQRLVSMAKGLGHLQPFGPLRRAYFHKEKTIPASARRLAWMLRSVDLLVPRDGRMWRQLGRRVKDPTAVAAALQKLAADDTSIARNLRFEGKTHADCLIECEHGVIWIEGKRQDWLESGTKWDRVRDQLARNLEAAWTHSISIGVPEYCLIICHEHGLKHHETALVEGYRAGAWSAGWPHLDAQQRSAFSERIGTLTWAEIGTHWPQVGRLLAT